LSDLTAAVLAPEYRQEETGAGVKVERCLIDSGWQTDTVYQFCRESPLSAVITPSKGFAVTTGVPISQWQKRPGERAGWHWRFLRPLLTFDPNPWKSQLAGAWRAPHGTAGRLALHGTSPVPHQLYAAHVAAEHPTKISARGREFEAWHVRPGEDNHWLDATVLAGVAASFAGLTWSASEMPATTAPPKPIKLSELQRQKQQGGKR
jgi:phage terminase large subunit GpA-like protein